VLQALLQIKPENFTREAVRLWGLSNNCFCLWLFAIDSSISNLPPCPPDLAVLSSVFLQYKEGLSAGLRSIDPQETLAKQITDAANIICSLACATQLTSDPRGHCKALFASPGLIDAALTQLAGLAKHLHKQHLANQLPSSAGNAVAKKDKKGRLPASVVGASTLAQLLLYPHHDNVAVAGGRQAIAAQAEALEQHLGQPSGYQDKKSAISCANISIQILQTAHNKNADSLADAVFAQPGGAAAVSVGGRGAGRAALAAKSGGLQLYSIPVAQLLLEVGALLCSDDELRASGRAALVIVLHVAWGLAPEDLLSFCEDAGALLLQVLWLNEQHAHTGQQDEGVLHEILFELVVPAFSGRLCLQFWATLRVQKSTLNVPSSMEYGTEKLCCC
jgi:hypothetical protein